MKSGLFSAEELEARMQAIARGEQTPPGDNDEIAGQLRDLIYLSAPAERPDSAPPAFAIGDAVRGRVLDGRRHARIPLYAQGKRGVVVEVGPAFPDPDRSRLGEGEHFTGKVDFTEEEASGKKLDE